MSVISDIFNGTLNALNKAGVGGKTLVTPITGSQIAVQAAAYASGDVLGTGNPIKLEVFTKHYGTGILQSVVLGDLAKQDGAVGVVIFNSNPTATTFTDNSALDIADADLPKIIGNVAIASTDYADFNDSSIATKTGVGLPINNNESASSSDKIHIWVAFVSRDTKTYGANELSANIGILQD
ncbi:MAG: hypothetical protein WC055_02115 [Melioribacteraceae bacterium]